MARFRIFPQSPSTNHTVQKLPQEIVNMIFALLSVPDQVCFSLCCKRLLAYLHSYLEAQETRLPQLLPRERRPVLCPNAKKRPRRQLLLQLQNNRWKYCSECWSLHPQFTWRDLRSICRRRQKPSHKPSGGEIDICPCLTITFRDKMHLIETCRNAREPTRQNRSNVRDNPSFGKLHESLWHNCTFADHPFAKANVTTTLWTEESIGCLRVSNLYKFEILQGNPSQTLPPSLKATLTRPHKGTENWLGRFFDEAGSSFLGWNKKYPPCPSFRYDEGNWGGSMVTGEGPQSFELTITRNLGNDDWSSKRFWNHYRSN